MTRLESILPSEIGEIPSMPELAYVPALPAVLSKLIDIDEMPIHLPQQAFLQVANGVMPESGGLVELPQSRLGAIDHVRLRRIGDAILEILPAEKSAVNNENDRIEEEGALILTSLNEGYGRIFGLALPQNRGWAGYHFSKLIIHRLGMDAIDFDVDSVNHQSGIMIARMRRHLY